MSTVDLGPTTRELARLVAAVDDARLGDPTPCPDYTVADLVEHVGGLTMEFTYAARKEATPGGGQADGDGSRLEPGWRERIAADLEALAEAWRDPAAVEGETHAGPFTMPAEIAFLVALDEVVVHAWDLAVATGQTYDADPPAVAGATAFASGFEPPEGAGDGPFGPPVAVADDATDLERLIGLTGRDPAWRP